MPFYGLVMAFTTRVVSEGVGARLFLFGTIAMWACLLAVVWNRLEHALPGKWWWISLVAAGVLAPAVSTIFWLQPNLLVLVLAIAGTVLAPKRAVLGGVLVGVSLALKPILLLLPLLMLFRRGFRTSGISAAVTAGVLSVVGLLFLAWRANDLARADPFAYFASFASKGRGPIVACVPENYSPIALLCRLGMPPSTVVEIVIALLVVIGALLLLRAEPRRESGSWSLLAIAGLLSPMVGPIDWSVYGLLFGPLLLLLLRDFIAEKAPARLWVGLAIAYLMLELTWDPLESLLAPPLLLVLWSYAIGQFGQYVLLLVTIRWWALRSAERRRAPTSQLAPAAAQHP